MDGAILSKSLTQFSVNGLNYDLALFGLRSSYGKSNEGYSRYTSIGLVFALFYLVALCLQ